MERIKNNLLSYFGNKKMDSNSKLSTFTLECPFAVKWEIEEEKLAALKDSENGCLITELFDAANISGVKYRLKIFPNGGKIERQGQTWFFLHLKLGNEKKIKADFKIFIESANAIYKFKREFETSHGHGGAHFTTAELFNPEKKFINNGKLILKCEGILKVEREYDQADIVKEWKEQSFLSKLWKANNYNDFTIIVDGKKIKTHKNVLAILSDVFDGMFNSGMKEVVENKMNITDFTYETVKIAIELMYDRKVSTLKMEEKMDVLIFLDKYCILDLKESLELSLAENISLSTVVQIANFSLFSNSSNLQQRCMDFMVASFRMNQLIDDCDDLDETFAFKLLKHSYYNVIKS